jgi:hypothetical protein
MRVEYIMSVAQSEEEKINLLIKEISENPGENLNNVKEYLSKITDISTRNNHSLQIFEHAIKFEKFDLALITISYISSLSRLPEEEKQKIQDQLNNYLFMSVGCGEKWISIIKALIAAGANPKDAIDVKGNNIILHLCDNMREYIDNPDCFCELLKIFVDKGADNHGADADQMKTGENQLDFLLSNYDIDHVTESFYKIAKCLKEHGVNPHEKFNNQLKQKIDELNKNPILKNKEKYSPDKVILLEEKLKYYTQIEKIFNPPAPEAPETPKTGSWVSRVFNRTGGKKTRLKKNKSKKKRRTRKAHSYVK